MHPSKGHLGQVKGYATSRLYVSMAVGPKDICKYSFLTDSKLKQLSQCHPYRLRFTSRMSRWQPMTTAPSHPQLFGPGLTNQGRLLAHLTLSLSQESITNTPAHLMHCHVLAGIVDGHGLVSHTGALNPGHYSKRLASRMHCIIIIN